MASPQQQIFQYIYIFVLEVGVFTKIANLA